ncbi:hypothetical protein DOY81_010255, partial [Sarcophaga bullata]
RHHHHHDDEHSSSSSIHNYLQSWAKINQHTKTDSHSVIDRPSLHYCRQLLSLSSSSFITNRYRIVFIVFIGTLSLFPQWLR